MGELLDRSFEWPELRSYETGKALPDTATATALASTLGVDLGRLLAPDASALRTPGSVSSRPADFDLTAELGGNVPVEVVNLWTECQLELSEARTWRNSGWDLLAAIPWAAADLNPEVAATWSRAGVEYREIGSEPQAFTPEEALAWAEAGIDRSDWEVWQAADIPPAAAASWDRIPVSPDAARGWIRAGFAPDAVAVFEGAGMSPAEATGWAARGFSPPDSIAWCAQGLGPAQAQAWLAEGLSPSDAEDFADLDPNPALLAEWRSAGHSAADIRSWLRADTSPQDAEQWSFTSSARAARLIRRGIAPEQVLERTARARCVLADANGWTTL